MEASCHVAIDKPRESVEGQAFNSALIAYTLKSFEMIEKKDREETAAVGASSGSYRPSIKTPSFNGNLAEFPVYYQQLKMKWAVERNYPNAELEFIASVVSNLKGPAALFVYHHIQPLDSPSAPTAESLMELLYDKYNDPLAAVKARNALRNLRHGNKPLNSHIHRFEELLYLSGYHELSDAQKIELLKDTLSPRILEVLYFHAVFLPPKYDEWANRATEIWQQILYADQHRARYNSMASSARSLPPAQQNSIPVQNLPAAVTTSQGGDWVDWTRIYAVYDNNGNRRRAAWVSEDVMKKRRAARLCFRCGASGHVVATCPYAPAVRPPSQQRVNVVSAQPPLLEDDPAPIEPLLDLLTDNSGN